MSGVANTNGIEPHALLEARGLGRRDSVTAEWLLRDIELQLDRGDRVAIVGPTGSGKTLLLRALVQLDRLDAGQVLWRGKPVRGDGHPPFRSQAIYLHQRPPLVEGTVLENLQLPYELKIHSREAFRRSAVEALFGQVQRGPAFLDRSISNLSGGEAQIVALVRAIQLQPAVLLLDEPTAALDESSTVAIERLIAGWFAESPGQRAYIWVSHNRHQVSRVADRVLTVREGLLSAEDGTGSAAT